MYLAIIEYFSSYSWRIYYIINRNYDNLRLFCQFVIPINLFISSKQTVCYVSLIYRAIYVTQVHYKTIANLIFSPFLFCFCLGRKKQRPSVTQIERIVILFTVDIQLFTIHKIFHPNNTVILFFTSVQYSQNQAFLNR